MSMQLLSLVVWRSWLLTNKGIKGSDRVYLILSLFRSYGGTYGKLLDRTALVKRHNWQFGFSLVSKENKRRRAGGIKMRG